jgi:hypothetical protein
MQLLVVFQQLGVSPVAVLGRVENREFSVRARLPLPVVGWVKNNIPRLLLRTERGAALWAAAGASIPAIAKNGLLLISEAPRARQELATSLSAPCDRQGWHA